MGGTVGIVPIPPGIPPGGMLVGGVFVDPPPGTPGIGGAPPALTPIEIRKRTMPVMNTVFSLM